MSAEPGSRCCESALGGRAPLSWRYRVMWRLWQCESPALRSPPNLEQGAEPIAGCGEGRWTPEPQDRARQGPVSSIGRADHREACCSHVTRRLANACTLGWRAKLLERGPRKLELPPNMSQCCPKLPMSAKSGRPRTSEQPKGTSKRLCDTRSGVGPSKPKP